jgi:hypothetical protein
MPDGTKVSPVKTADDFADMVAAEVAAVETDETALDETLVADTTAARAAFRYLLGLSKRKHLMFEKRSKR